MNTASNIYNYIQGLNPSSVTISSMGNVIDANHQQLADSKRMEVMSALNQDTLAYKIASTADRFSAKQLWVIAFELEKSADFVNVVSEFYNELQMEREADRAHKSAKRQAKKESKKQVEEVKAANVAAFNGLSADVMHARFGKGVKVSEDNTTVTVLFELHGEKKLAKAYAQLQSI